VQQLKRADVRLRRLAVSCGLEMERTGPPSRPHATHAVVAAGRARTAVGVGGTVPREPSGADLAEELWQRFGVLRRAGYQPLWQLDGRPMSGDVGAGTAHGALRLLEQVGTMAPPGPLQLAGGTNQHTLELLQGRRVPSPSARHVPPVAGVAFGGAARRLLQPLLLEAERRGHRLLEDPELWPRALALARGLVEPWLCRNSEGSG
jgi:hypothetical protein